MSLRLSRVRDLSLSSRTGSRQRVVNTLKHFVGSKEWTLYRWACRDHDSMSFPGEPCCGRAGFTSFYLWRYTILSGYVRFKDTDCFSKKLIYFLSKESRVPLLLEIQTMDKPVRKRESGFGGRWSKETVEQKVGPELTPDFCWLDPIRPVRWPVCRGWKIRSDFLPRNDTLHSCTGYERSVEGLRRSQKLWRLSVWGRTKVPSCRDTVLWSARRYILESPTVHPFRVNR